MGDGIRRNIATLPQAERDRFRDAILDIDASKAFSDAVSYWDKQDQVHQATHVHGGPRVPAVAPRAVQPVRGAPARGGPRRVAALLGLDDRPACQPRRGRGNPANVGTSSVLRVIGCAGDWCARGSNFHA